MNYETLNKDAVIVDQARAKYYLESVYKLLVKTLKGVWAIYEVEANGGDINTDIVADDTAVKRLREFVETKVFKYCDEHNVEKYHFKVNFLAFKDESVKDIESSNCAKFEYICESVETKQRLNISFVIPNEEEKICYLVFEK